MLFDTHVHTEMSADSSMLPEEALSHARRLGIGLIFTEHVDFESDSDLNFVTDVSRYLEDYAAFKSDSLMTGLEIGLTKTSLEQNRRISTDPRLDYIIGSIHWAGGHDLYTTFFSQKLPRDEIYRQYLGDMADMIELFDCFDSLGHIDYPSRYSPFDIKDIAYQTFQPEYDRVFRLMAERGKALEINTRRLGDKNADKNYARICEGFRRCGGRFCTIGSDAHRADDIGHGIWAAYRLARLTGLTPVYYRERRMYNIESSG